MERAINSVIINQDKIEEMMRRFGKIMKSNIPEHSMVHNKEGFANFVTDDDVRIQKELICGLSEIFPECGFYGEEDTAGNNHAAEKGLCFFIDPIDGTTNYVFGYHHSCISVGVSWDGKLIAGFVFNPYVDDFYSAIRGCGSFLNGRKLHIKDGTLDEGIVAFGCARYNDEDTDAIFEITKELYLNSLSIRNGGSSTLDLCRIASGSNAAYVELKLQPYDYAAASVIIEEAGGVIGQADGAEITLDRPCSVVAGTAKAVEQVKQICRKYLP